MTRRLSTQRHFAALGLAVAGALIASPEALAQGCAMCKTAVEGSDDPLAKAIAASSIFMIVVPLAVMATIASWVALAMKRGQAAPQEINEIDNGSNLSE